MNARTIALFLMLNLCCGLTATATPAVKAPTLEGDPRLPAAEIGARCSPEQWKTLRVLPYRALVILDVQLQSGGSTTGGTIRSSEPDDTWSAPARTLAKKVRLKASSVGSHILPAGEVFVIFYGQGEGRRAMVYARQRAVPQPGTHGKATYFAVEQY